MCEKKFKIFDVGMVVWSIVSMIVWFILFILFLYISGADEPIQAKIIFIICSIVINSIFQFFTIVKYFKRKKIFDNIIAYGKNIVYVNFTERNVPENIFKTISDINFVDLVWNKISINNHLPYKCKKPILCFVKRPGDIVFDDRYGNRKSVFGLQRGNEIEITFYEDDMTKTLNLLLHEIAHVLLSNNGFCGDQHSVIAQSRLDGILTIYSNNKE